VETDGRSLLVKARHCTMKPHMERQGIAKHEPDIVGSIQLMHITIISIGKYTIVYKYT